MSTAVVQACESVPLADCDTSDSLSIVPSFCGEWDFFAAAKARSITVPPVADAAAGGWLVFESGDQTFAEEGAVRSVTFSTLFQHLSRIRVECDLSDSGFLYHHVFTESGCQSAVFEANLLFTTSDVDSVLDSTVQATGCRRVRLLIQRSSGSTEAGGATALVINDLVMATEGCPTRQFKDATTEQCEDHLPGFRCPTQTGGCAESVPCGDEGHYCVEGLL